MAQPSDEELLRAAGDGDMAAFEQFHGIGKLRLDVTEGTDGAYRERNGIAALKPGDPNASEVWLRIIADDPNTDIILTAIYLQVPYLSEYLPERLIDLQRDLKKPLIVSPRGFSKHVARSRAYLYSKKFHTYTVPMIKPMSIAIKVWCDYGRSFIPEE